MTLFAIERNGSLVNQLVFRGNPDTNLYRDPDIMIMTFTTLKAATEMADVLHGTVVDYEKYTATQAKAA